MYEKVLNKIEAFRRMINFDDTIIVDNNFTKEYNSFKSLLKTKLIKDEFAISTIQKFPKFRPERLVFYAVVIMVGFKLIFIFLLHSTGIVNQLMPLIVSIPFVLLYREIYLRVIEKKRQKLNKYLNELKEYLTSK